MLPRSKFARVLLVAVPLILLALLWKASNKRPHEIISPTPTNVNEVPIALALSHDGSRLAEITSKGRVWWKEGEQWHALSTRTTPEANDQYFSASRPYLQFSRDGRRLFGTGFPNSARDKAPDSDALLIWDLSGDTLNSSGDGVGLTNCRLTVGTDKTVQRLGENYLIWDLANAAKPTLQKTLTIKTAATTKKSVVSPYLIHGYALSSDSSQLIIATKDYKVQFWDVASGKMVAQSTPAPGIKYEQLTILPSFDNRFIILSDYVGMAVWDQTAKLWTKNFQSGSGLEAICWMPDGRSLWASGFLQANGSGETQQVSVPSLQTLRTVPQRGAVAISGDGNTLAMRGKTMTGIRRWNIG